MFQPAILAILEGEGISVRLNATCIGFSRRGEEILAHVDLRQRLVRGEWVPRPISRWGTPSKLLSSLGLQRPVLPSMKPWVHCRG